MTTPNTSMSVDELDEIRHKLRALPRTDKFDFRYPIDAYEDDLVELIEQYARNKQVEEVLDRLVRQGTAGVGLMGDTYIPLSAIEAERNKLKENK